MTGIKFDEEKVINCIKSYHDMHGEYPYLICGEETIKIIQEEKKDIKSEEKEEEEYKCFCRRKR